jgi:hypothetical protein
MNIISGKSTKEYTTSLLFDTLLFSRCDKLFTENITLKQQLDENNYPSTLIVENIVEYLLIELIVPQIVEVDKIIVVREVIYVDKKTKRKNTHINILIKLFIISCLDNRIEVECYKMRRDLEQYIPLTKDNISSILKMKLGVGNYKLKIFSNV